MHSLYNKRVLNYIILLCFITSLTGCESFLGTPGVPAQNPRTASIEPRRDEEVFSTSYNILFDSGSIALNKDAEASIKNISDLIKKSEPTLIIVSGHSDSFGNSAHNQHLSRKRAQAVVAALKKRGIEESLMTIKALGEAEPLVPTQDGVKILENRRVMVELRK